MATPIRLPLSARQAPARARSTQTPSRKQAELSTPGNKGRNHSGVSSARDHTNKQGETMNSKLARIAAVFTVAGIVLFGANGATAAQTVPAKSIGKAQLAPDVSRELEYGKVSTVRTVGGKLSGHSTQLGQFTLPAGTWLITTSALFFRVSASTKTARPELVLKYGDNRNAGLISGAAISPNRRGKLAESAVQTVTFLAPTNIGAFGSVTNDDGSTFMARQILVSAQVTATRIR